MPRISEINDHLSDIQGNILRGYGPKFATYRFYYFKDGRQGKDWLNAILQEKEGEKKDLRITTSDTWVEKNGKVEKPPFTLNIAFSHSGLETLELPSEVLQSFPEEFKEGMYARAVKILGDEALDTEQQETTEHQKSPAPKHWEKGFRPDPNGRTIHALVILASQHEKEKNRGVCLLETLEEDFPKVQLLNIQLEGAALTGPYERREHFGYVDGISQPFLEGTESLYSTRDDEKRPPFAGQGIPVIKDSLSPTNTDVFLDGQEAPESQAAHWKHIKPGEFLLGYEDELGEVAQAPAHYDLRKNGTYLVLRKLEQNVPEFQKFLKETAKQLGKNNRLKRDTQQAEDLVAAKLMGRWKSGCPLMLSDKNDTAKFSGKFPKQNNDFLYTADHDGLKCPLGSHIRRTNPRDQLPPAPQTFFAPEKDLYHLNRHRIIRRGLTYGSSYPSSGKRGVIFMALNASISQQFEFIQQQWINDGDFLGLDTTSRDPLLGKKDDGNATFTIAGTTQPFVTNLKRFVTERGGEYFFYPGLSALRAIAEGEFKKRSKFVSDFHSLNSMPHSADNENDMGRAITMRRAAAKQRLVVEWLIARPKELFDDLRQTEPILFVEPINPPKDFADLGRPPIMLISKYHDVVEILKNTKHAFSVALYTKKMAPPRGPFVLGMDNGKTYPTDQNKFQVNYQEEIHILRAAIPSEDLELKIRPLIEKLANEAISAVKDKGSIDVIGDLAWKVPLEFISEYLGVPHPDIKVMRRWCRDIFKDLFLNIERNESWIQDADQAVDELTLHLNGLIQGVQRDLQEQNGHQDTILCRLVRMQEHSDTRFKDGLDGVRRNLIGILIGIVETTLKAVARTVDQLFQPNRHKELKEACRAALTNDDVLLSKYIFEAMRFNPQNPFLPRLTNKEYTLAEGTSRQITIPANTLVLVGTLGAMFDPEKIDAPEEFRINRPADNYLFFGHEQHNCLGEHISRILVPVLIKHLLTLDYVRRADPDSFHPMDPLPKEFRFEFLPTSQKVSKKKVKGRIAKKITVASNE